MAIEQTEVQPLPFVIESVAPARLKLWATFAAQIHSDMDFSIASDAYFAFWYDNNAFYTYRHALRWVEGAAAGDVRSVSFLMDWLDGVANALTNGRDAWFRVTQKLLGEVGDVAFPRHYKDAERHVGDVVRVLAEVRQFGVAVCQEFGLAVPESFVEQSTSPTVPAAGEGIESR